MSIEIEAVAGIGSVQPGDDISHLILNAAAAGGRSFQDGDIVVVAQKIVSKAENRYVDLNCVTPSERALDLAVQVHKDPRKVQIILNESAAVLRARRHPRRETGVIITRHRLGFVSANAAVDESNIEGDRLLLLPLDPDSSARAIRDGLSAASGCRLGVVISDTFGRPWRLGLVNVAIGLAGIPALIDLSGTRDAFGRVLQVTAPAFADEVAAAAGLAMGKDALTPVILVRGLSWQPSENGGADLIRPIEEDLFT